MFINMNKEAEPHKSTLIKVASGVLAALLFLVILETTQGIETLGTPSTNESYSTVANLGKVLYGQYLLPFEIISIMLLAAMVGAVMLGKKSVD
jgi:NADH-quinone oxidoreductase subunit J